MKNNNEQRLASLSEGEVSSKALARMGVSIQKTARTVFKLSAEAHRAINFLSESFEISKREVLDIATGIACNENNQLPWIDSINPTTRKSYAITNGSSEKLAKRSKQLKISRDTVLESAIWFFIERVSKIKLTTQEKIKLAKEILEKTESIEQEFCKALFTISDLSKDLEDDKDFEQVSLTLGYIEQINELSQYVQEYIVTKKQQLGSGE